ncbi:hypothetical protein NDU88_000500 [Pleurodeles waltl]|uniref:Uncharacterized protein n=1 Tax=Pleurodeles waltl TaxID=8319 RepID=A0AAV7SWM5_PLEWA|nr:hypothetical protein NDU88_000500 [Pleurodeles waltl]
MTPSWRSHHFSGGAQAHDALLVEPPLLRWGTSSWRPLGGAATSPVGHELMTPSWWSRHFSGGARAHDALLEEPPLLRWGTAHDALLEEPPLLQGHWS